MAQSILDEILAWFKPQPERPRRAEGNGLISTVPSSTNLSNWMAGGTATREREETRALWAEVERAWRASPLAQEGLSDRVLRFVRSLYPQLDRIPATPILVSYCDAAEAIFRGEPVGEFEANWELIDSDVTMAVELRQMLARRRRWCLDYDRMQGIVERQLRSALIDLTSVLPDGAFGNWAEDDAQGFGVPLIEMFEHPDLVVGTLLLFPYDDDTLRLDIFLPLRRTLERNLKIASNIPITEDVVDHQARVIGPSLQKNKTPAQLADLYLAGTPFAKLMELRVPFEVPTEVRFEHCHIIGGTGHGKTQLMQSLIHADLVAAKRDGRSVVVIDSQGDLINKLSRMALFDPEDPESLADRLVVIDPADVEFPASLNLFDAHLDRVSDYRPVDRERVLNGVVELYEVFFGALLGAELTQKQGVIFKYLARLMLTIPGATIHTLMQLMEDGKPFREHMRKLDGSARYFFETEFFHPSFNATKRQILKRLWGVLSTPAFERMFAQKANKLDLFAALNGGKIILINTAKDLLKDEGSQLFGRFFIALLSQAALERSALAEEDRTPTFVYVDEAQEYFDDRVETILTQARKYRVGLTLAHQTLDQLSPRLRSAIHANTSFKCAGGVSNRDARALADELHTSADFIESMRRRPGRTEFAVWLKHRTPNAIRLSVPLGFVEGQPILSENGFETLVAANRERYCGTLDQIERLSPPIAVEPEPPAPPRQRPPQNSAAVQPAPEPPQPQPPSQRASITTAPVDTNLPTAPSAPAKAPEPRPAPPAVTAPVHTASSSDPPAIVAPPPRPRLQVDVTSDVAANRTPVPPQSPQLPGKGGSQHRYLQQLIKQLAEDRGFRAVIEEAVEGGQVDVGLHRGDLTIACEISITSTPAYEAQNLAKCLRAGFTRVWSVAPDVKRRRAVERQAKATLGAEQSDRIEFITTEELIETLDALAVPAPTDDVVKGYRVKTTRRVVSAAESRERRDQISRILSRSARDLPDS